MSFQSPLDPTPKEGTGVPVDLLMEINEASIAQAISIPKNQRIDLRFVRPHQGEGAAHPWSPFFFLNCYNDGLAVDVSGQPIDLEDSATLMEDLSALSVADDGRFLKDCFQAMGVDTSTFQPESLRCFVSNGSPNAAVYRIAGVFGGRPHQIAFTTQHVQDDETIADFPFRVLKEQYESLLFYTYQFEDPSECDGLLSPPDLPLRAGRPSELVQPLFANIHDGGRFPRYSYAARFLPGMYELNRPGQQFDLNDRTLPDEDRLVAETRTLDVELGLVRIVSQMYASTFDEETQKGFFPFLTITNGSFVIGPSPHSPSSLRVVVTQQPLEVDLGVLVDQLCNFTGMDNSGLLFDGRIFWPEPQKVQALYGAIISGFEPVLGTQKGKALARKAMQDYADRQGPAFEKLCEDAKTNLSQSRTKILRAPEQIERNLPVMRLLMFVPSMQAVAESRNEAPPPRILQEFLDRIRPDVVPTAFIDAIKNFEEW